MGDLKNIYYRLQKNFIIKAAFFTLDPQGTKALRDRGDKRVVSVWFKKYNSQYGKKS
jgi:hypothetical protein